MAFTACTDDDNLDVHLPEAEYGSPNEWYYSGGKLGTTSIQSAYAYRQATQAVDDAGLSLNFQIGESLFEKDYNTSNDAFAGLGPVYVRRGCLYCHPNYGHHKSTRARSTLNGRTTPTNGATSSLTARPTRSSIQRLPSLPTPTTLL